MTAADATIRDAISKLAREDAAAAVDADAALEWLTAGAGVAVLTQENLQTFLWYGLPMKWLTDTEHHRRVVDALARAFDLLDLTRYAEICRSETTASVLDAYENSAAWRVQHSGEPADDRSISWSTHQTLNLCRALNLLAVGGHWNDRRYGLNTLGRATAIEALHHTATGPHANPLS